MNSPKLLVGCLAALTFLFAALHFQDCSVMGPCIAECGWMFVVDDAHVQVQALGIADLTVALLAC